MFDLILSGFNLLGFAIVDDAIYLYIALALAAAGSYATYAGNEQTKKAINSAQEAEQQRQKELQDRSTELFNKSLEYNDPTAQMAREAEAQRKYNDLYQQATNQTFDAVTQGQNATNNSANAPRAIADAYKNALDTGKARIKSQLEAKANLSGLGDVLARTQIQNQQIANQQAVLGGFMKGSAGVLPMELNAASHKGDTTKNIGTGLSTLGSVLGAYGSAGMAGAAKAKYNGTYGGATGGFEQTYGVGTSPEG